MTDENVQETNAEDEVVEQFVDESPEEQETEEGAQQEIEASESEAEESSPSVESNDVPEGVQNRFNKLTGEKYGLKRENDELKRKLAEATGAVKPPEATAPKLEDFDFDDAAFNAASIKFQVDQGIKAYHKQNSEQVSNDAIVAERNQAADSFALKEAEFSAGNKDYEETVANLPQFPDDTLSAIFNLENGPQMAHYLGKHLDVAHELANANPMAAAVRLGQIAAGLATSTRETVSTSSAPEPVETLGGGSALKEDLGPRGATYE